MFRLEQVHNKKMYFLSSVWFCTKVWASIKEPFETATQEKFVQF